MASVLTQAGEELLADLIDNSVTSTTWYGAWGTGAGTAVKGDTTLKTEASESRVTMTTYDQVLADKLRWIYTITCAGAGKTITNAGILNNSTGGTLLLIGDFTGIALNVGDSIQFTFTFEIA